MCNRNFQSCQQQAALPLDPDSMAAPQAESAQRPPLSPLLQVTPNSTPDNALELSESNLAPEQTVSCQKGLCLPQPYPIAAANAKNERYARIIRNSFAGQESTLTAMMTCLYHAMRFGECADDLQQILLDIAMCKMHHLKLLGDLLLSLGGDPKFFYHISPNTNQGNWWAAYPTIVAYSKNLGDALLADISAEKSAIEEHHSAINYIDDQGVSALLKRIVLDEEYHLKIFNELHQRFCS